MNHVTKPWKGNMFEAAMLIHKTSMTKTKAEAVTEWIPERGGTCSLRRMNKFYAVPTCFTIESPAQNNQKKT